MIFRLVTFKMLTFGVRDPDGDMFDRATAIAAAEQARRDGKITGFDIVDRPGGSGDIVATMRVRFPLRTGKTEEIVLRGITMAEHPAKREQSLDETTYTVELKTVDGRFVKMYVVDGRLATESRYRTAVTTRLLGMWPFPCREDNSFVQENPFRPLQGKI